MVIVQFKIKNGRLTLPFFLNNLGNNSTDWDQQDESGFYRPSI